MQFVVRWDDQNERDRDVTELCRTPGEVYEAAERLLKGLDAYPEPEELDLFGLAEECEVDAYYYWRETAVPPGEMGVGQEERTEVEGEGAFVVTRTE